MTPAQTALSWLRAKPYVTAPIVGANRPAQLIETLEGLDKTLATDDLKLLDDVSDFERPRTMQEM